MYLNIYSFVSKVIYLSTFAADIFVFLFLAVFCFLLCQDLTIYSILHMNFVPLALLVCLKFDEQVQPKRS